MTLVSAGAGWGKSVLAAQWCQGGAPPGPVAWLSVDADCADPGLFWSYVIAALRDAGGIPPGSELFDLAPPPAVTASFLARLVAGLEALPQPVVLVLDDLDRAGVGPVIDDLRRLVRHLPAQLRLVLLARTDAPLLSLHRLLVAGDLVRLRPADLSFTRAEARQLLGRPGLALRDDELDLVLERTEGWPAGLRLAALWLHDQPDPTAAISRFAGDTRPVADYLTGEVLAGQPADVQHFLLRTSVVDRFTAELADRLTGGRNGRQLLDRLEASNAFVVGLDSSRDWYRYHHLFADLLRHRLAVEAPGAERELHRRAAEWFAGQDEPLETVRHAVQGEAWGLLGRYVVGNAAALALAPEASAVLALLHAVPASAVADDPELTALVAFAHFPDPDPDAMRSAVRAARAGITRLPPGRADSVTLLLAMVDAVAARRACDLPAAATLTEEALAVADRLTHADVPALDEYRALALVGHGNTLVWLGRIEEAETGLVAGLDILRRSGRAAVTQSILADGYLGLIAAMRGRLGEATRRARAAIEVGHRIGWSDEPPLASAYLALVLVHLQRAENDACADVLASAKTVLDRRPDGPLDLACQLAGVRLLLDEQRGDEARRAIDAVAAEVTSWPDPSLYLLRWLDVIRSEADLALGNPAGVVERLGAAAASPSPTERPSAHELVLLGRAMLELGDVRAAARLVEPLSVLPGLDAGPATEAALLAALAADRLRQESHAMDALSQALAAAEGERFLRPFVLSGQRLRPLLLRYRQIVGRHDDLAVELLDRLADDRPGPVRGSRSEHEKLTQRELAVLALLPTMMSNAEIAVELFLSINTVKTHLNALYRKLGVENRRDAVRLARRRGLLVDR
ncbi:MAG TPA: LuxR C-terminal-related transcriptional regulator [Mycobacteriales bacterium]